MGGDLVSAECGSEPIVLIVDDEVAVREGVQRRFTEVSLLGSLIVSSPLEAREALESEKFNIVAVVTDWFFGGGVVEGMRDGVDLVKFVRERYPEVQCYMMTAHMEMSEFSERLQVAGDIRVFRKDQISWVRRKRAESSREPDTSPFQTDQPWNVVRLDLEQRQVISDPLLVAAIDGVTVEEARNRYLTDNEPSFVTYLQRLKVNSP